MKRRLTDARIPARASPAFKRAMLREQRRDGGDGLACGAAKFFDAGCGGASHPAQHGRISQQKLHGARQRCGVIDLHSAFVGVERCINLDEISDMRSMQYSAAALRRLDRILPAARRGERFTHKYDARTAKDDANFAKRIGDIDLNILRRGPVL